jgi:hypothetical protein
MTEQQDRFANFDDVISSLDEIRKHIGEPVPPVVAKVMGHIDHVSRAIIEKSPFIVMASATPDGYPDISPKGDPPEVDALTFGEAFIKEVLLRLPQLRSQYALWAVDQNTLHMHHDREFRDTAVHGHALAQRPVANDPRLSGDPQRCLIVSVCAIVQE